MNVLRTYYEVRRAPQFGAGPQGGARRYKVLVLAGPKPRQARAQLKPVQGFVRGDRMFRSEDVVWLRRDPVAGPKAKTSRRRSPAPSRAGKHGRDFVAEFLELGL